MVFDVVKLGANVSFWSFKHTRQVVSQVAHLSGVREPLFGLFEDAESRSGVQDFLVQVH